MALIPYIHELTIVEVNRALRKLASSKLGPTAEPTYKNLTLTGLTASLLISTDANKKLTSVSDLSAWILQGSVNQVRVNDEGDGTVTLFTPQNIHTGASPTFAGLTSTGTVDASAGKVLVEDKATSKPDSESDGYIGVAKIGNDGRIYFFVEGNKYYATGALSPVAGNPIGLLLTLTYSS